MVHFITREDLLQWLERNCTRKAVVRALQEGTVEHLGAFTKLGPYDDFGWIVRVTNWHGRIYTVEIIADENRRFGIYIRTIPEVEILWEYWDGVDPTLDVKHCLLFDGDDPMKYMRLRDERRAEITKENRAFEDTESESESES